MFIAFLFFVVALGAVNGDRRAEVIKFMEKNNFLERCRLDGKSEDDCIKDVKRYCGIQHVGDAVLTDELMGCVRKPKCGLPMLPSIKRSLFTTAIPKFTKRRLTYVLLNKGTNNTLTQAETQQVVDLSFEVWRCYTKLQFISVNDVRDADIFISFTPRYHGYYDYYTKKYHPNDPWPFDGQGGVLAHAFFPLKIAFAGNFHYDDEEVWIENHRNGVKLFHTTVHELGHALGIAHTPKRGNIMYGVYDDSYHETVLDLGPYDKDEIQKRYGARECTRKIWQEHYKRKFPEGDPGKKEEEEKEEEDDNRCVDKVQECAKKYRKWQCTDQKYKDWIRKNCRVFCGLCVPDEKKEVECVNTVDYCSDYRKDQCTHPDFKDWMSANCRVFCGLCTPKTAYSVMSGSAKDEVCAASRIDGAFKTKNGDLYLIINGYLYRQDASSKEVNPQFKKKISDLWDSHLIRPTAAAYQAATDTLYLFQGQLLFIVKGFSSDRVRTTYLRLPFMSYITNPTAAFMGLYRGRDVIYVYHKHVVTGIAVVRARVLVINNRPFERIFNTDNYRSRIPSSVDGAFQDGDKVFFLTGSSVTIAHRDGDRYTLPSSMTPFMTDYLKCPQVL